MSQQFIDDPALLVEFIAQTFEHLDDIETKILACESDDDCQEHVDCVFRAAHTIKGTSAFFDLHDINSLCHKLEAVLDRIRKKERPMDKETVSLLLTGFDIVRVYVEKVNRRVDAQVGLLVSQEGPNERVENFMEALDGYLDSSSATRTPYTPAVSFEVTDKLIKEFQYETTVHLESAEESLIRLDRARSDPEAVNELFRAMHSIKGIASYLRLEHITKVAHAFENVLDLARSRPGTPLPETIISLCFTGMDALKLMTLTPRNAAVYDASELLARLANANKELAAHEAAGAPAPARAVDPLAIFVDSALQHVEAMRHCYAKAAADVTPEPSNVDVFFRAAHSLKSSARYMQFDRIEHAAMIVESTLSPIREGKVGFVPPVMDMLGDALEEIQRQMHLLGGEGAQAGDGAPSHESQAVTDAGPGAAAADPAALAASADAAKAAAGQPKTMRINQQLLDVFMNLVGELIVARNALTHVGKRLQSLGGDAGPLNKDFQSALQSVSRISESMQRSVMEMRMVPVRTVFMKVPRMIRDIAHKSGKNVDLLQYGEDTEIDKGIAEEIGDPLVHLIRNAVDHGVEAPGVRRAAGKPEKGTIILKASHQGNSIVIEIIDDGAGMDPVKIGAKAVEKGLVAPERLAEMSDEEIFQFIFYPGFSTAAQVTDISGRGVGMDVVRTNLQKLNGSIRISSEVGHGTLIRLELPLTLAIVEALLIKSSGQTFAIPVEAVRETVKAPRSSIKAMMKKRAITLRGELIGVEPLSEILSLEDRSDGRDGEGDVPILVLQNGRESLGLVVDELLRREEIVIKPLVDYLAGLPGLAGASILGDGRALLILDPGELIAVATRGSMN